MANVLVIDDDAIVNALVVQLLTDAGHKAEGAYDGKEGMKLFNRSHYDLVVTDVVMPEKEGLETIIEIRAANKKIPIIAMSGGGKGKPDYYLDLAKNLGADYVFQKPFSHESFLGAVRECLAGI